MIERIIHVPDKPGWQYLNTDRRFYFHCYLKEDVYIYIFGSHNKYIFRSSTQSEFNFRNKLVENVQRRPLSNDIYKLPTNIKL